MVYPDRPQQSLVTLTVLVILLLTAVYAWSRPADLYDVIDLGPEARAVEALDEDGNAYGTALLDGAHHAAMWTVGGDVVSLGLPEGYTHANVTGHFDGKTVGTLLVSGTTTNRAFIHEDGAMQELEYRNGPFMQQLNGASGVWRGGVVGHANDEQGRQRAAQWNNRGQLSFLPTLAPDGVSEGSPEAVNRHGQSVGRCTVQAPDSRGELQGYSHACMWVRGKVYDLDTTPGPVKSSTAADVNDWQAVVGTAYWPHGYRGFLWWGHMMSLEPLPGDTHAYAGSINNLWDICGSSTLIPIPKHSGDSPQSVTKAVCWFGGQVIDLHARIKAPGWTLYGVPALNNRGVIVATGRLHGQGPLRFVLLVPQSDRVARR